MNITALLQLAALSLACSAVAVTLTKSSFFSWLRVWARKHLFKTLAKLVSCPYCASHWIAAGLVGVYQPVFIQAWLPFDLFVSVMVTVALSALVTGVILFFTPFGVDPDLEDHG